MSGILLQVQYDAVEVGVSLTAGFMAGSAALIGWGLDSVIEVISAGTLRRRLKGELKGINDERVKKREKITLYVIAASFLIVSIFITYDSVTKLAQIPALFLAYTQGPQSVLYVLILYNGVQLIESNLLLPLIQQRMVAIPPALILLSQALLGIVAGIFGVILAVPLLVILMVFIKMVYLQDILGDPEVELQAESN